MNGVAQLTFTHDDADRVLTATSTPAVPNALPTSTFTYAYDAAGNLTSTQGPGGNIGYGYDANSQLSTITDPASGAFAFGYDATGRRTSMTRPNGIADSLSYNAAGNLTSLHSTLGASLANQADYAYNPAGLRSSLTNLLGTTTYTYDRASQLTSATPPAGSGLPNEQYTYDPDGNRISSATSPLGSFSYDSGDRLLGDATTTYAYDSEGNLVSRTNKANGARTTYTWTAEHQLVGIEYPDHSTSTLRYDPLGRRVEIAAGSAVRRYAFDQGAIAAEYDSTNALAAIFVHPGVESFCPLEMVRDGQRYFYLADGRQSTAALTDLSGATSASYRYQAFGTPLQIGSLENPFEYLCIYFYGIAGLGLSPSGPYDPGSSQSLNDDPISYPGPNPFPGPGGPGNASGRQRLGQRRRRRSWRRGVRRIQGQAVRAREEPADLPEGLEGPREGRQQTDAVPEEEWPEEGGRDRVRGASAHAGDRANRSPTIGFILRCQIAAAANSLGP